MKAKRMAEKFLAVLATLVFFAYGVSGQTYTYTATQSSDGYTSPGSMVLNCGFSTDDTAANESFAWILTLPAGLAVTAVSGGGFASWDFYLEEGKYWIWPSPSWKLDSNSVSFNVTVSVPAGQSGDVSVSAQCYIWYDTSVGELYLAATPDPLLVGQLTKTLQVISAYGTAAPPVGLYTNLAGALLNMSVTDTAYVGTTQYMCSGWSMSGNAPASGTTNSFSMTVTDNAVLTWNWSLYNVAPVITNSVSMLALRTKPVTLTEAALLVPAYDPLELLTVTAVNTTSAKGSTITWSGGILGYTPPTTNRLGFTEEIQYTVKDGHNVEATGTITVTVPPAGTAIRVL